MIQVKICGLINLPDALQAVHYGASAVGFVFAPSKRQVDVATVRRITAALPPFITKIGVFVNEAPEAVREILRESGLDLAQLHGEESPADCEVLAGRVIKVFKAGRDRPDPIWRQAALHSVLIDTYNPAVAGGSGRTFDWQLFEQYRTLGWPLILAGGLTPANIGAALRLARPAAVDVSSGVERRPGVKDPLKIREFMEAISCRTCNNGILESTADALCRKP
ncbi:MAG: phosphoribosylanthranilate isomerase [Bacillota bacterium]|jgi:phosphoribosylanthranilate isomerase